MSIRGFGARSTFGVRGVRLYVDGIPATMPDGQGQLSHIDLASAGRIEVLRGPFSALYGNSSGGVLQVFTEPGAGPPQVDDQPCRRKRWPGAARFANQRSYTGLGLCRQRQRLRHRRLARAQQCVARPCQRQAGFQAGREGSEWTLVANAVKLRADDPLGLTRAQFEAAPAQRRCGGHPVRHPQDRDSKSQLGLIHEHRLASGDRLRLMVYGGERDTDQFQAIPVAPQASPLHPGGVIGLERRYAGTDLRWTSQSTLSARPAGSRGRPVLRPHAGAPARLAELCRAPRWACRARCGATKTTRSPTSTLTCKRSGSSHRAGA